MVVENKLGITNSAELAREEERLTKKQAKDLLETGTLFGFEIGTFKGLAAIHKALFAEVYDFAGKIRDVNIAKDNFQFAPRIFLEQSLTYIDRLPHQTFDEIVDKYADMNIAHPFREGNGRSMRLWLDCMLQAQLGKVVDWNAIDKEEYLNAMIRSHVSTGELKYLLQNHLTDDLSQATFFKGIDASYYYEGYTLYKTEDL
ncbi:protein adenylyltransferase Fic [Streptococcus ruminantium]|uniref:protein adenylyltransferase n=1 Tax=Streptococcus ruminantium TaxID=1917441 RepID=A0ABU1B3Q2_9STRE|nr:Fic family protein [Streptococcus ruminantium]MDQ8758643.1 Fic family protein [Streptococcus ruminantium]MDQ8769062.1 Fic family protein [Streptococcus ruminantium]MDQ8793108.1 Fic family protein [Streptococcus ruminantium]MDQ8795286.1 Fic family protein [Streptococcus ruminantium]MDQ8804697.1 Fic family protein [Streptococcus ruminantium]